MSVLTGSDQVDPVKQAEIAGVISSTNGMNWQNNLCPLWNGKEWLAKSFYNTALGDPQYYESVASKPPIQSVPHNTDDFFGWDTRFPDT